MAIDLKPKISLRDQTYACNLALYDGIGFPADAVTDQDRPI
jgi:hypothetical protein